MYYFITDHLGNVRLVVDDNGTGVEESDYLTCGTENVITSTITNKYKFIGMESFGFAQDRRDTEGTAEQDPGRDRRYSSATMLLHELAPLPEGDHPETSALLPRSGRGSDIIKGNEICGD